jgi:hypothetical protein
VGPFFNLSPGGIIPASFWKTLEIAFTLAMKKDKFFTIAQLRKPFCRHLNQIQLLGASVTMHNMTDIEQGLISGETICELVGEAMNIHSVALGQPTQFIILNEIESLSKASEIVPHHPLAKQALAAIVVCGDLNGAENKDKWMFDCETASQKLLLAANASGLSAHISTIYPDKDKMYNMSTLLDLPDNIIAHSYVAMGSPAKITGSCEAFSNERVHFNGWVIK